MKKIIINFQAIEVLPKILIIAIFILPNCISFPTYQTAEITPPGRKTIGVGMATFYFIPSSIDIFARFGVSKSMDIGLMYNFPWGGRFDTKFRLAKWLAFDLAGGGFYRARKKDTLGYVNIIPAFIVSPPTPFRISRKFLEGISPILAKAFPKAPKAWFYLALKGVYIHSFYESKLFGRSFLKRGNNWGVGVTLGLSVSIGKEFRLMPEVNLIQFIHPISFLYLQPAIAFSYTFK